MLCATETPPQESSRCCCQQGGGVPAVPPPAATARPQRALRSAAAAVLFPRGPRAQIPTGTIGRVPGGGSCRSWGVPGGVLPWQLLLLWLSSSGPDPAWDAAWALVGSGLGALGGGARAPRSSPARGSRRAQEHRRGSVDVQPHAQRLPGSARGFSRRRTWERCRAFRRSSLALIAEKHPGVQHLVQPFSSSVKQET